MKKFLLMFAAAAMSVSMASATTLFGTPVSIASLDGETLQIGDKLFSNFAVSCTFIGTNTCGDETSVKVQGIQEGDHFGVRFTGPFVALENIVDYVISFNVTVLDPNLYISAIGARFNGEYIGAGTTEIVEDAFDGVQVGKLKVTNPPEVLTATFGLVNPYPGGSQHLAKSLFVQKDMLLTAIGGDGLDKATVSIVDQWFVQTGEDNQVPEPGTYALMGAGLIGLAFLRRRKA